MAFFHFRSTRIAATAVFVASVAAGALFQNCDLPLNSPFKVASSSVGGSGNGEGYGGKPRDEFINLDLDGACGSPGEAPAVRSLIRLTEGRLLQTVTDCFEHEPIDVTAGSSFMGHNVRVAFYGARLYESREALAVSGVSALVCRGQVLNDPAGRTGWADITLRPAGDAPLGPDGALVSTYSGEVVVGDYADDGSLLQIREGPFYRAVELGPGGPNGDARYFRIDVTDPSSAPTVAATPPPGAPAATGPGLSSGLPSGSLPYTLLVYSASDGTMAGDLIYRIDGDPVPLQARAMECVSH